MKEQRLQELFDRYINLALSEGEETELMYLLTDPELAAKKGELLEGLYDHAPANHLLTDKRADAIFNNILDKPAPVKRMVWKRWAVAASILLTLGLAGYFFLFNKGGKRNDIVKTDHSISPDIKSPGTNRAMITLADGRKVALDSLAKGTLAVDGNMRVVKTADGQIIYNGDAGKVEYNTLFNPRGSKVTSITLVDGSKVWLNAESSLKYFTSVGDNERRVEITGEAYFEVTHDAQKPFIVNDVNRGVAIQVLGTHFNINTYSDEAAMKVTLLEGSVKVTRGTNSGLLVPGQQAVVISDIKVINDVDIDAVMAWKNGVFHFDNTSLQDLVKQLGRWYDIEVEYKGKVPERGFGGEISREANLSQVLKILNESKVQCRMEGRKLIVE